MIYYPLNLLRAVRRGFIIAYGAGDENMHKKRWAALVVAAALVLTGCSFGGLGGGGGNSIQKIDRPAVESAEQQFTHPAAGDMLDFSFVAMKSTTSSGILKLRRSALR